MKVYTYAGLDSLSEIFRWRFVRGGGTGAVVASSDDGCSCPDLSEFPREGCDMMIGRVEVFEDNDIGDFFLQIR